MHDTMNWASEPDYVRLFILFLAAMVAVFLLRWLNLFRRLRQIRQQAESGARYLWDLCDADVKSMTRMPQLIILISLLVLTHGVVPTWNDEFGNRRVTGATAFVNAGEELLGRLTLGLLVSAILYVVSGFLEEMVVRRKAHWKSSHHRQVQ